MRTLVIILIIIQSQSEQIKVIDVSFQNWTANITQRKTNFTHLLNITKNPSQRFLLIELFAYSKSPNLRLLQSYSGAPFYDNSQKVKRINCDNADENEKQKYHYIILDQKNVSVFSTYVTVLTNKTINYGVFITGLETKPCPNNCSNNGECIEGICKCQSGYTDQDCSQEGFEILPFFQISQTLNLKHKPVFLYLKPMLDKAKSYKLKLLCQANENVEVLLQIRISEKGKLPNDKKHDYNISLNMNQQLELNFIKNKKQKKYNQLTLVMKLELQNALKKKKQISFKYEILQHDFPEEDLIHRYCIIFVISLIFIIIVIFICKCCSTKKEILPQQIPQAINQRKIQLDNLECLICWDDYSEKKNFIQLNCNHIFHEECIQNWFKYKEQCPTCRINGF